MQFFFYVPYDDDFLPYIAFYLSLLCVRVPVCYFSETLFDYCFFLHTYIIFSRSLSLPSSPLRHRILRSSLYVVFWYRVRFGLWKKKWFVFGFPSFFFTTVVEVRLCEKLRWWRGGL